VTAKGDACVGVVVVCDCDVLVLEFVVAVFVAADLLDELQAPTATTHATATIVVPQRRSTPVPDMHFTSDVRLDRFRRV